MTMKTLLRAIWYGAKVIFWLPVILFILLVMMPVKGIDYVVRKKLVTVKEMLDIYRGAIMIGIQRDMLYIRTGMKI